ncbi:DUF4292 domain-containing protein [Psychroflexus lacisalsi]|uniref:Deoxyuridine 5'-triphosphate nucleotidohydrolase n=1 Tax=Psychroflexus lacisalsi TaxID=503928 RepID=A0ABN1K3K1_9FLAO|nr:DUF4292 domain-containing protein [Psychroflexus lacisalsi]MBZ9618787.1 DUF4292 domain-containing protein [Psychroflexus lacisalsi]
MNKSLKRISLVLIIFISLTGCKSSKVGTGEDLKEKSARAVIRTFENNLAEFKTVNGKIKAGYETESSSQSISITYRIEKDKAIWMSAKVMGLLPIAKVYITPDRFQYYEKINRTYFDGDFSMAKEFLGVEVNFENLQNLLIGRPMYELKRNQMLFDDNAYVFLQNIKSILAFSAIIDSGKFEMKSQSLVNTKNESLKVDYFKFQSIDNKRFPSKLLMKAKKDDEEVLIDIDYRSVIFDEELSFPFSIPNNYERLEL